MDNLPAQPINCRQNDISIKHWRQIFQTHFSNMTMIEALSRVHYESVENQNRWNYGHSRLGCRAATKAKVGDQSFQRAARSSLESVNHGILILDLKSKITFFNKQLQTLFEIPEALASGKRQGNTGLDFGTSWNHTPIRPHRVGIIMTELGAESSRIMLKDGRCFSRYTKPHYLKEQNCWPSLEFSRRYGSREIIRARDSPLGIVPFTARNHSGG